MTDKSNADLSTSEMANTIVNVWFLTMLTNRFFFTIISLYEKKKARGGDENCGS
jgi:hypothetical protein